MPTDRQIRYIVKPAVFAACLIPFFALALDAYSGGLGAEPIKEIIHRTGDWTLRMLLVVLAVTPLRHLSGRHWLIRLRRMLGLFSFFYACLHMLAYVALDQFFDWSFILQDIVEHKYIMVGMASFLLLLPLAVTSTNAMMRRLGGRRWQRLHRLVYASAIGGVVHFLWLVKADLREPLLYASILAILLGYRVERWLRRGHYKHHTCVRSRLGDVT